MIWIFGGTTEGKNVVQVLDKMDLPYVYSTKTKVSIKLSDHGLYRFGAMDMEEMKKAFVYMKVSLVIDAAHPFAEELHRNIFDVCHSLDLRLVRYERKYDKFTHECIHYCESLDHIIESLLKCNYQRIFVMTGVQNIPHYMNRGFNSELYYRIIDCSRSKELANKYGVDEDRLFYFPLDMDFHDQLSLMKELHIDAMVTKESGSSGYFGLKAKVAMDLGIDLYVWKRPKLPLYDEIVDDVITLTKTLNDV
ncbi:MAG: precorrin-6A/cobalt-precorrin-6A reductase [Prolixibacteraceae bacterium]|jgi:precorrin-6x reductase|nr:precorrin-6A/cobalt-precorrin-6A reductase [Prolixibacteraceae bacterium]